MNCERRYPVTPHLDDAYKDDCPSGMYRKHVIRAPEIESIHPHHPSNPMARVSYEVE